jgi:hypothetical protein
MNTCAANSASTDGTAAGRDICALLTKAADVRDWEDDARSPARSIARVLSYRIKRELGSPAPRRTAADTPARQLADPGIITNAGSPARPLPVPMPVTRGDDHLRHQLGDRRWKEHAADERRRDVAAMPLTRTRTGTTCLP